ncbi:MAG TPA: glycogen debranching protein GlgX [Trichormus sp.]|jgi:glycogen operon protein
MTTSTKVGTPQILDTTAQRSGLSFPLGATVRPGGVNFCVFSKHATGAELLLFDHPDAPQPSRIVPLDHEWNKSYYYWHVFIPGIKAGQVYAWRMHGPNEPERGLRFDSQKVLLDPYALAVANWKNYSREAAIQPGDNCAKALRAVVINPDDYDWGDDVPLRTPPVQSVIYEMHVGGLTRNPNSGVPAEKRGTFAGVVEKIPYLKSLGITAVELMPVCFFDEQDAKRGLTNYWGYSPVAMFAPHARYSSHVDPSGAVNEFRDMVKALHSAGIEVILDVVYNHTAEGNENGPTLSLKGFENPIYYLLDTDHSVYSDYSGCGNTINANHPIAGRLILQCLRYWVEHMHVDGFRFDLASALSRDLHGKPEDVGVLWTIESDPVLAGTKLIAEAWDSAGLYQVGNFVNRRDWYAEWNGPFRDDIRRFVKGDGGTTKHLAERILGSPDIYTRPNSETARSINFITCHDGFTLNDVVSYNDKHNEANGEDNRDGNNSNYTWNCGAEGDSDDPQVDLLRRKQIKNALTILFFSQGTPMMLMGDEVRRTQRGNNNAYCQDNELSWFDWSQVDSNVEMLYFTRNLIYFVQGLSIFRQSRYLSLIPDSSDPHIVFHGIELNEPDFSDNSHSLAFTLVEPSSNEHLHVIINEYWDTLTFELPSAPEGNKWCRIIDTAKIGDDDFHLPVNAKPHGSSVYKADSRSVIVLQALPQK